MNRVFSQVRERDKEKRIHKKVTQEKLKEEKKRINDVQDASDMLWAVKGLSVNVLCWMSGQPKAQYKRSIWTRRSIEDRLLKSIEFPFFWDREFYLPFPCHTRCIYILVPSTDKSLQILVTSRSPRLHASLLPSTLYTSNDILVFAKHIDVLDSLIIIITWNHSLPSLLILIQTTMSLVSSDIKVWRWFFFSLVLHHNHHRHDDHLTHQRDDDAGCSCEKTAKNCIPWLALLLYTRHFLGVISSSPFIHQ